MDFSTNKGNIINKKIIKVNFGRNSLYFASFELSNYNPRDGEVLVTIGIYSSGGVMTINSTGGSNWERANSANGNLNPEANQNVEFILMTTNGQKTCIVCVCFGDKDVFC